MNFDKWISDKLNQADYPADQAMWQQIETQLKPSPQAKANNFSSALISGIAASFLLLTLFGNLPNAEPNKVEAPRRLLESIETDMKSETNAGSTHVVDAIKAHQPQAQHEIALSELPQPAKLESSKSKLGTEIRANETGSHPSAPMAQKITSTSEIVSALEIGIKATGIQCPNTPVQFEAIGTLAGDYHWIIDGIHVLEGRDIEFEFTASGTHEVVLVYAAKGQTHTTTRMIEIYDAPTSTATVSVQADNNCFRQEVTFGAEPSDVSYSWRAGSDVKVGSQAKWHFEEGLHNVALTVVNAKGCTQQQTISADVRDGLQLFIPTGFSPDNNGQNDEWFVAGLDKCVSHSIQIYRMSDNTLVFQTTEGAPWTGAMGQSVEMPKRGEQFIYRLKATDACGFSKEFSGTITAFGR